MFADASGDDASPEDVPSVALSLVLSEDDVPKVVMTTTDVGVLKKDVPLRGARRTGRLRADNPERYESLSVAPQAAETRATIFST